MGANLPLREKTVLVREKRGRELRGEENVTSHIYVLLLAKFARMPGLGNSSGGKVKPILSTPGFCKQLGPQPLHIFEFLPKKT